jgi:acylphosphatase
VPPKRVRVLVAGDVQGVGFRWYCRERATEAGVGGWVRNLPDGRVEAVLEGPRDEVYRVVGLCRAGPRGAKVANVQVDREPPKNEKTFKIR